MKSGRYYSIRISIGRRRGKRRTEGERHPYLSFDIIYFSKEQKLRERQKGLKKKKEKGCRERGRNIQYNTRYRNS